MVDAAPRKPACDEIPFDYLAFDPEAGMGEGCMHLLYRALVVLATRSLARQEAAVGEVGGHQLTEGLQVGVGLRFQEATHQGLVPFCPHAMLLMPIHATRPSYPRNRTPAHCANRSTPLNDSPSLQIQNRFRSTRTRQGEVGKAVVATDTASADADCDNGTTIHGPA